MTKQWEDNFEALLAWLDPDRDQAGQKYEEIRQALIHIFSWRGCYDAEDLADDTITRVINKLPDIVPGYEGNPALYFYGVAKNVLWEVSRRDLAKAPQVEFEKGTEKGTEPEVEQDTTSLDRVFECLEACLQKLPAADRELAMRYYQQDHPKVKYRKTLARRLGIEPNNLRVKLYRIRVSLHSCIVKCLAKRTEDETN
jgi:RNA polymerase sigma factor (sigma-70 family)